VRIGSTTRRLLHIESASAKLAERPAGNMAYRA
jgi:hypothetical protein